MEDNNIKVRCEKVENECIDQINECNKLIDTNKKQLHKIEYINSAVISIILPLQILCLSVCNYEYKAVIVISIIAAVAYSFSFYYFERLRAKIQYSIDGIETLKEDYVRIYNSMLMIWSIIEIKEYLDISKNTDSDGVEKLMNIGNQIGR